MNVTTLPPSEISSLTDSQQIILSLLPIPPAILSITCSSIIIGRVTRARFDTPYRRILFALSITDIILSTLYAIQPFLLPSDTSQRVWAFGNDATCTFLGFGSQLAISNVLYNAMLSFYFLLTIRYGMKEDHFTVHYERWMHLFCIVYPIVSAIAGVAMGVFHEVELGTGCYYKRWPEGCIDHTGECKSEYVAWGFAGIFVMFTLLAIVYNNVVIFCYVRKQMKKAMRNSLDAEVQAARIRAVAVQAFLYVAFYIGTFIWTVALRIMESQSFNAEDEADIYPLLVIHNIAVPSTGIFNLCIYLRPKYLRVRKNFPSESRYWAVRRALYGETIETNGFDNRQNSTTAEKNNVVSTLTGMTRTISTSLVRMWSKEDLEPAVVVQYPEQAIQNRPVQHAEEKNAAE